jgi:hypothetical protein
MSRRPAGEDWIEAIWAAERTVYRVEQQAIYIEDVESGALNSWLAGGASVEPAAPEADQWVAKVAQLRTAGGTFARIRIHHDPPTPYQQWERWSGAWNTRIGEHIGYLARPEIEATRLAVEIGPDDWYLIDDHLVLILRFDQAGRRVSVEIDDEPDTISQHRRWWTALTAAATD